MKLVTPLLLIPLSQVIDTDHHLMMCVFRAKAFAEPDPLSSLASWPAHDFAGVHALGKAQLVVSCCFAAKQVLIFGQYLRSVCFALSSADLSLGGSLEVQLFKRKSDIVQENIQGVNYKRRCG